MTTEVYAGRSDVAAALAGPAPWLRPLPNWNYQVTFAAADPVALVEMERAGTNGLRRLSVSMENAARARALVEAVGRLPRTCLCGVVNQTLALEEEIHRRAESLEREMHLRSGGIVLNLGTGTKGFEDKVRATPEMKKRAAAARDAYVVRYRLVRAYPRVLLRWSRLLNYHLQNGEFEGVKVMAETVLGAGRRSPDGQPAAARLHVTGLEPGAYRLRLAATSAAGETRIDERTYWFDGKLFQEI